MCHGWGRGQQTQTTSWILLRHIQSVWAHWYAGNGHTVAALNRYAHMTWLRFWGSGSYVDLKWCHFVMIDADSYLKMLPASILDIYKVFEYILTQLYPHYLDQTLGFWVKCGVKPMSLHHHWGWQPWQPPQIASPIQMRHMQSVEHIDILSCISIKYCLLNCFRDFGGCK